MSVEGTQTEFDFSEFETTVTAQDENRVIETIDDAIGALRNQIDDDTIEEVFRSTPGSYQLRSDFTTDHLDPEPFTKGVLIEPLLDALGYENYGWEAGDLSDERGQQADYSISLRDIGGVDSARLLIEAEPINKSLMNSRGHGVDQVDGWLRNRDFESDFGFATDGIRWIFIRYDPDSYSSTIIEEIDLQPIFLTLFENAVTDRQPAVEVLDDEDRELVSNLLRTFGYQNFISIITDAREVIKRKQEEITDEFYDDYVRLVFGIGAEDEEGRRARSLIGEGVVPPDEANGDDIRLFAVELMNRLIFVKFLEDKHLVDPNLLGTLEETYEDGIYADSLYSEFLEPLFYDVLNEKPEHRKPQVQNIDLFTDVPYLNGGLFRPQLNSESEFDERDFDVRDTVLEDIIDLLEHYQFSADGGPTDIDPSILGNVFEKTINYITIEPGDKNKELGAYYTPSEITRFCAEETVRPALLDRFKEYLRDEWGWREAELDHYDDLYDLIDVLTENTDLITGLLEDLDEFYVVDPACGSGHFLTSVVEELVNARQALYARMDSYPSRHRLKKTTVQNNIYGVDIMEPAVEIAKLRLWLSIIAELQHEDDAEEFNDGDVALPNIVFNVRRGNSLIGYVGFPEETDNGEYTLERWNEDSVRSRYEDIIEQINLYQESSAFPEQAEEHRQKAKDLLQKYRTELNSNILTDFQDIVDRDITGEDILRFDPFHWVLEFAEVYANGGFDVVVGNPPWDMLQPRRDEFFSRFEPEFRSLDPSEKDDLQQELLDDPEIQAEWEEYKQGFKRRSSYFTEGSEYTLQWGEINGKTRTGRNDLSMLFLERVFNLTDDEGYVAQILPGKIFINGSCKNLRLHLLNETSVKAAACFENQGIFSGLHNQYNLGITVFKNSGESTRIPSKFSWGDVDILRDFKSEAIEVPRTLIENYSPEGMMFPYVKSEKQLDVMETLLQHPPVSGTEEGWDVDAHIEIYTRDSDYFTESRENADYPVYGGSNMYQFCHDNSIFESLEEPEYWSIEEERDSDRSAKYRVREKNLPHLKRALYQEFGGGDTNKSMKAFVNDLLKDARGEPLSPEDVKLDCTEYRIAFRNIAYSTNERTAISAVLPPGIICYHALTTIRPYRIDPEESDLTDYPLHNVYERAFSDQELFSLLGLLNSIPFDFLMRMKVDVNIARYKFNESPVPYLTEGDDWFEYIWTRAAQLNCYGEAFEDIRDRLGGIEPITELERRKRLQAEIDAAVCHVYGLDRTETEFVLEEFHKVNNPRVMTPDYFDLVLEQYDELNDIGPQP